MDLFSKRLSYLIQSSGLNQSGFAKAIGTASQNINAALKGRRELSDELIDKICALWPAIGYEWIKKGKGELPILNAKQKELTINESMANKKPPSELGKKVKELRIKKGLKLTELGRLANTTHASIIKLEDEGVMPGIDMLQNIAKALDTTVSFLIDEQPKKELVKHEDILSYHIPLKNGRKAELKVPGDVVHEDFEKIYKFITVLKE